MDNFVEIRPEEVCQENLPIANQSSSKKVNFSDEEKFSYNLKFVIVGDSCVGKTSIIRRFIENAFDSKYTPSLTCEFFGKTAISGNKEVNFKLWDIGGDSQKMMGIYLNKADAILCVYDIANEFSFNKLYDVIKKIHEYYQNKKITIPYLALIQNKQDLFMSPNIQQEMVDTMIKSNCMKSFLTSAKIGTQVTYIFLKIASDILNLNLLNDDMIIKPEDLKKLLLQNPEIIDEKNERRLMQLESSQTLQKNPTIINDSSLITLAKQEEKKCSALQDIGTTLAPTPQNTTDKRNIKDKENKTKKKSSTCVSF